MPHYCRKTSAKYPKIYAEKTRPDCTKDMTSDEEIRLVQKKRTVYGKKLRERYAGKNQPDCAEKNLIRK
jgi:hypothetical protein